MYPIAWKLLLSIIFVSCAAWYAKSHFYRDPGSAFFDPARAYEQQYSLTRKAEIQQFIESQSSTNTPNQDAESKGAALCVGISSVKRTKEQYLEKTIASLLTGLTPPERADLHLSTLIAEPDATTHPAWNTPWLHQALDDLYTYNTTAKQTAHLATLKESGRYSEKGVFDYTHALARCYDSGTPYIGMFEDDILLADGWLVRTLQGLQDIESKTAGDVNSWLYMRLFNQERSTGWASHRIGGNNEFWIILGIGVGIISIAAVAGALTRLQQQQQQQRLSHRRPGQWQWQWYRAKTLLPETSTLFVLVCVLNPALVLLFFQCGKASVLPPAPGVFEESFGCCSQAMVFPRVQAPLVMEYLRERGQGQIDLMLDRLAEETALARFALYPVLVQHIGMFFSSFLAAYMLGLYLIWLLI
ncbi:hypothetical protein ASPVEDRAFT_134244 [Aspergillus versicolor CBS 583.65]|uniref:Glycosyltransferase 2-like domain-containing protein n=1 Tax=Aspergillus versicolor CBS 583.65 TaxID=1036611 RepID=A0A1L9PNU0_ASPVE|nr:uncharacterized protein ASPVEDRAFT_134244 [Aspergillus versicolor CBS 583.65]OJJ03142.1 hypothetical protein ASPVEDRAFT_134244 [Aspergillus versicolor CBS 583.65]